MFSLGSDELTGESTGPMMNRILLRSGMSKRNSRPSLDRSKVRRDENGITPVIRSEAGERKLISAGNGRDSLCLVLTSDPRLACTIADA